MWQGGLIEHVQPDKRRVMLSVVFSWQMQPAFERACFWRQQKFEIHAGGPAVRVNPEFLRPVANIEAMPFDALAYHNPEAMFTSRGCIRRCAFCAVPTIEGDLTELQTWQPKPIICDNNLLACSRRHFDQVIDSLKGVRDIDFNQGLDARLLTPYHAGRIAGLHLHAVRLAWDNVQYEGQFRAAFALLRAAGIPGRKIHVYVLIGYHDTPDDAYYRLEAVRSLGGLPNPMRYQPIDTPTRNAYAGAGWTHHELVRFMRYYSNLRVTAKIPFHEFSNGFKKG